MGDSRSKDPDGLAPIETDSKPDERLAELRDLLLEPHQRQLDQLQQRVDTAELQADEISKILPEAVSIGSSRDKKLSLALEPITTEAIKSSIRKNRQVLVEAIFPLMGPAIRKAISTALQTMLQSFNQILENSMSLRGLKWRLEALRTQKSFAEVVLLHTLVYQVEQVFLIHRETGLLLQNVAVKSIVAQDPDLVSGMLSAIQDFVHDSFGASADAKLETLRVGDQNVWIEQGRHAILAAVIRGNPPRDLQILMQEALDEIRFLLGDAFRSFDGDPSPFEGARVVMENCLRSQFKGAEPKTPIVPLVILGSVLVAAGVLGFWLYRGHARWSDFVAELRQQPGIVVTSVHKDNGVYRIGGLRDPLAIDPSRLLPQAGIDAAKVNFHWEPYHSPHSSFAGKRLADLLQPPEMVTYRFENGILSLNGIATSAWLETARHLTGLAAWITNLDESGVVTIEDTLKPPAGVKVLLQGNTLKVSGQASHLWVLEMRIRVQNLPGAIRLLDSDLIDLDAVRLKDLSARIESTNVSFPLGSSLLEGGQIESLQRISRVLREFVEVARLLDRSVIIHILGHADRLGPESFNRLVSLERAQAVHRALLENGLPPDIFKVSGAGSENALSLSHDAKMQAANRRVTFQVVPLETDPGAASD